jgi:preprotein translocase subunit SecE
VSERRLVEGRDPGAPGERGRGIVGGWRLSEKTMEGVQTEKRKARMNGFWRDLFHMGLYKRSQGKITRQVTFAAIWAVFGLVAWRVSETVTLTTALARFGVPILLLVAGAWLGYRLVNMPIFADFLIAVEAEMSKVTWPTRKELFRGSVVVIVTIVSLGFVLVAYDFIWSWLLRILGVGFGG